jgi:hypothetical protein
MVSLGGCFPGRGHVTTNDGVAAPDQATPANEASLPREAGKPPADGVDGPGVKPDTQPPPPTCPAPFGNVLGVTAANFKDIPDCADQLYALHDYCGKKKGVLIAMMSPT